MHQIEAKCIKSKICIKYVSKYPKKHIKNQKTSSWDREIFQYVAYSTLYMTTG